VAETNVTLRVEARNAISSLNKTSQATKTLSKNANGATKSLTATSTAAKGLGASLAASLGPLLTVGAAFATVGNAIGTFTARERDVEILRQGLVNLGAGTVALNELQEAANKLGNQTLFNQEEFTRGFNLLTSFRKIGVNSYKRVAQAAADIAQVNQVDVSTSFMQLAKALQDPERNLSNLNRSGIAFTQTQQDVIKELMKTNKTAEAHSMILQIVEESYNGLSQAASEGFAGNVDSLGEAFRDFSETLGKQLEPALIAATKGLTELITATNNFIQSPIGKTALIFTGIALAAKAIPVLLAAVSAGLLKVAYAGGLATIALNAIPFVAIATGIGAIVTQLIKQKDEQDKVTQAIKNGEKAQLEALEADLGIKMAKEIAILNRSNDRRTVEAAKRRLAILRDEMKPIKERLDTVIQENAVEKDKNKTIKENKDIQEEINKLINDNLKKAIAYEQAEMDSVKAKGKLIDRLSNQRALAQAALDGNLEEVQTQQEINALVAIHGEGARDIITAYIEGTNALKKQKEEADELKDIFEEIGSSIATGVSDALTDAAMGAKTLGEAAVGVLQSIGRQLMQLGINTLLFNMFGGATGIFKNLPTFAAGGMPPVGKPSIVGEKGPEIFVPSSAGKIIPNNQLGGGTVNNINVSVDASGSSVEGDAGQAEQLGQAISQAIQAELMQQKRPGGLLYS
jgi:hypothetical protein